MSGGFFPFCPVQVFCVKVECVVCDYQKKKRKNVWCVSLLSKEYMFVYMCTNTTLWKSFLNVAADDAYLIYFQFGANYVFVIYLVGQNDS